MPKRFTLACCALAALATTTPAFADDADAKEPIAEAAEPWTSGSACRIACAGLYGTSCAAVGAACLSASTVTLGGVVVPCAQATILACGGGALGLQACQESCPP